MLAPSTVVATCDLTAVACNVQTGVHVLSRLRPSHVPEHLPLLPHLLKQRGVYKVVFSIGWTDNGNWWDDNGRHRLTALHVDQVH